MKQTTAIRLLEALKAWTDYAANRGVPFELISETRLAIAQAEAELKAEADAAAACTGISAGWCPVHGDCTCADPDDKNDDDCPLHSERSNHGEGARHDNA